MAERILQANRVDVAIGPQALGADTTVSSGWFSMREWAELAAVLLLKGVLVAGETVTLGLRQATSAAGAGAKALASKVVTAGAAAGNLLLSFDPVRRAVLTLDTVIAGDAVTVGSDTLTVVASVHTITLDTVIPGDAVVVNGTTKTFRETSVHTATLSGVGAEDAITVNGNTFTFVIEDAGAGEVLKGASDTEAATNLAAAIDALAGVTATAADAVVTIKGTKAAATVATEDASITVAAVAAGANDVLMGATDAACAITMAGAINGLAGMNAAAVGAVIYAVAASSAATITTPDTTITVAAASHDPSGNVALGSDDEETAENLAAAAGDLAGVTASQDGDVVTLVGSDLEVSTEDTTITILMSAVADGDAVEINGETLTFKAVGTGTEGAAAVGEVLLGDDDDDAAANLADAISLIEGLTAVDTAAAGETPASVAVSASVPAGVTVDLGDTTIAAGTTEDIVTLGLDVSALDVNAGFAYVQVQATASGAGLTGAATLLRGGGRVAVRQDV